MKFVFASPLQLHNKTLNMGKRVYSGCTTKRLNKLMYINIRVLVYLPVTKIKVKNCGRRQTK